MKIRNSIKIFVGFVFLVGLGLLFTPKAHSFYADVVQYIGAEYFLNNGQAQFLQSVNGTPTMTIQQLVSPTLAESSILSISSASASTPLFQFTQSGHFLVNASTGTPTASANCAVGAGSSDTAGTVVISGGGTSACTITFNAAYNNIPVCMGSDATVTTSVVQTAPTKTTVVLTISSTRNDTLSWLCVSR